MTQSLGARATSLAASAVLLGAAVFAAFSVSIRLGEVTFDPPPPIPFLDVERPQPPPITRPQTPRPPPPTEAESQETTLAIEPVEPTETAFTGPVDYGPPGPPVITNPQWLRRPRDLARYYPPRPLARNISGQVVLDCLVNTNGALNCSVVSETPANWGFAAAALRISRDYRMAPAMRDGQAVEARYRMRVPFEVD